MSKIQLVPVEKINVCEYNPRAITEKAFNGLKKSIEKFGMELQPLVVNERPDKTTVLVSGHQRLKAAIELGWKNVPVIYVNLSEIDEKTLNVVLNNKETQGFFIDELDVILNEIKESVDATLFAELNLEECYKYPDESWESDIDSVDKIKPNEDGIQAKIVIQCPQELKDEVLFFIKGKLLETSFEGVHVK